MQTLLSCNLNVKNKENGSTILLKATFYCVYRYTRPVRGELMDLKVPFVGPGRCILSFQVQCEKFCNTLLSSLIFVSCLISLSIIKNSLCHIGIVFHFYLLICRPKNKSTTRNCAFNFPATPLHWRFDC